MVNAGGGLSFFPCCTVVVIFELDLEGWLIFHQVEKEEEAQEGKKGCGMFSEWCGQNSQDCKRLSKLWCWNSLPATWIPHLHMTPSCWSGFWLPSSDDRKCSHTPAVLVLLHNFWIYHCDATVDVYWTTTLCLWVVMGIHLWIRKARSLAPWNKHFNSGVRHWTNNSLLMNTRSIIENYNGTLTLYMRQG